MRNFPKTSYLLFFLVSAPSAAQDFRDDIPFFDLKSTIKEVKRSVVSIEALARADDINRINPTLLGSGFVTMKTGNPYAITNYHVVRNIPQTHRILVGVNFAQGKAYFIASLLSADPKSDIAVLAVKDSILSRLSVPRDSLKLNQVTVDLPMYSDTSEMLEGEAVVIVGFPLGIGSEIVSNEPVSRIGIVAQSLNINDTFLLDATASHGNSGSPVFNIRNNKLMGMIVGFRNDYIEAFDETQQVVARLPYNSGICLCISARAIMKILP